MRDIEIWGFIVPAVIYALTALTDMLDGKIARKQNLITDFGKFLDPLADKMLTTAAFLGFIALNIGYGITWIAFIVLFREFLVSSLRLVAVSSGGKVIAANIWGKLKTVSQMTAIIFALTARQFCELVNIPILVTILDVIISVLLWISAILCVVSGAIYLLSNKEAVDPSK